MDETDGLGLNMLPKSLSKAAGVSWAMPSVPASALLSCCYTHGSQSRLGGRPPLATSLLLLNDRHRIRDEFHATVAAVGASVQLAVVVEVVLAIELVLAAELARESVGAFSVEPAMKELVKE